MKILTLYGNPKLGGFVHGCLDHVASRLEGQGAAVDRLHLAQTDVRDCQGCFTCLRTGACPLKDAAAGIIERVRQADGLVVGASVRNGYFPALYKRFYERITYLLGFGRELMGKHVVAVGAVGMATGKRHLGRVLTLRQFHAHVVAYLFFRTGIPTRLRVESVAPQLDRAADRLARAIRAGAGLSLGARLSAWLDGLIMRKCMFEPNRDGTYDYVIRRWREMGWMD